MNTLNHANIFLNRLRIEIPEYQAVKNNLIVDTVCDLSDEFNAKAILFDKNKLFLMFDDQSIIIMFPNDEKMDITPTTIEEILDKRPDIICKIFMEKGKTEQALKLAVNSGLILDLPSKDLH